MLVPQDLEWKLDFLKILHWVQPKDSKLNMLINSIKLGNGNSLKTDFDLYGFLLHCHVPSSSKRVSIILVLIRLCPMVSWSSGVFFIPTISIPSIPIPSTSTINDQRTWFISSNMVLMALPTKRQS